MQLKELIKILEGIQHILYTLYHIYRQSQQSTEVKSERKDWTVCGRNSGKRARCLIVTPSGMVEVCAPLSSSHSNYWQTHTHRRLMGNNGLFSTTTKVNQHLIGKSFWILMRQEMMMS